METLNMHGKAAGPAPGDRRQGIVGVVASGNLEVLLERVLESTSCEVHVKTPIRGYSEVWQAVVDDFIERCSPGGLRISINDGGATPDTVSLRLAQGVRLMESAE